MNEAVDPTEFQPHDFAEFLLWVAGDKDRGCNHQALKAVRGFLRLSPAARARLRAQWKAQGRLP